MSLTNTMEGAITMSVYTVLSGEHSEVRALLKTLRATPDMMPDAKLSLFEKVRKEVLSHARAEQEVVYSKAAERIPESEVDEAKREHAEIEQMLIEIEILDPKSQEWDERLQAFENLIEHHVKEEEEEMFENMKAAFTDEEAKEMGKAFHEAKKRELELLEREV